MGGLGVRMRVAYFDSGTHQPKLMQQKGATVLPISRARKEELVAQYVELLQQSDGLTIVNTQGMTVQQVQALRKTIWGAGGQYVVAKNTLITKALEQVEWEVPAELLKGPTAIVFGKENFPGVVKALIKHIDDENIEEDKMKVTGGVLGGTSIFDESRLEEITNLPTLPEVQAQIIGLLVQPATGLVSVLNEANSGVVNVLQAADTGIVNVLAAWINKMEQENAEEGAA